MTSMCVLSSHQSWTAGSSLHSATSTESPLEFSHPTGEDMGKNNVVIIIKEIIIMWFEAIMYCNIECLHKVFHL